MNLSALLTHSIEHNASDLHLASGQYPILRIHGELVFLTQFEKLTSDELKKNLFNLLDARQQQQFSDTLELDFACFFKTIGRFRINAFHQANGIALVFRTIPETIPNLDQLNLPTIFKELVELTNGLILITGPTGSGKSTTLAALVDYINSHQASHIVTIEDPIEFTHSSKKSLVNQRELHRDTKSFQNALKSALREDPDVILVGEMRDLETIRLALTAAETGHLVMATLHTSSAPRTISRIVDVFPAEEKNIIRNMLSESLKAIICQTLVKKVNGGRVPAFEIMLGTSAIRHLIREDKIAQLYSTMQTSSAQGMCTLDQSLLKLIKAREINQAAALECALDKNAFHQC